MKKLIILFSFIFTIYGCANDKSIPDIEYQLTPLLHDSIPNLKVSLRAISDENGMIKLRYENNSWGDQDIFDCIYQFELEPKAENIRFIRDSSQIIIYSSPHRNHSITYHIKQDFSGLPTNQNRYRPMMDSNYFHILGMRLFMVPELIFMTDTTKARIKIVLHSSDEKSIFHSSFGHDRVQNIEVIREDLYASFFIGGDFKRYHFTHENDTIYFLSRGDWTSFSDEDIFELLNQTIKSQYHFWNDPRGGNFSVSLVPTFESWYSVGGSGFSNSFISFASNNDQVTLDHMRWLYNHELLHKWIGRTIQNEDEVTEYWFSEGFTDYYAYKLQLKSHQIEAYEFLKILNEKVILPHLKDPMKEVPNSQLTFQEYWGNYATYQKLPYRRGLLYAFLLDNQIKISSNYSKSLDDVMHDLLKTALKDQSFRLNATSFLNVLNRHLNVNNLNSDFEKYILDGKWIDFDQQLIEGLHQSEMNGIPMIQIDSSQYSKVMRHLEL